MSLRTTCGHQVQLSKLKVNTREGKGKIKMIKAGVDIKQRIPEKNKLDFFQGDPEF